MKLHSTTRLYKTGSLIGGVATALALAAGLAVVPATAASAATSTDPAFVGLFGSQDPTYDGVYRQSLSLIVLDASGATVPEPAGVPCALMASCLALLLRWRPSCQDWERSRRMSTK